jgi:hypothetical protein
VDLLQLRGELKRVEATGEPEIKAVIPRPELEEGRIATGARGEGGRAAASCQGRSRILILKLHLAAELHIVVASMDLSSSLDLAAGEERGGRG